MSNKKPFAIIPLVGIGLFAAFLVFQFVNKKKDVELADNAPPEQAQQTPPPNQPPAAEEDAKPNSALLAHAEAEKVLGHAVPPPSEDTLRLNSIQKELATLPTPALDEEILSIKSKIKETNMIERLKGKDISDEERKSAKDVLIRLALLNVEKSKRGIAPVQ